MDKYEFTIDGGKTWFDVNHEREIVTFDAVTVTFRKKLESAVMSELNDFQKWCKEILPIVQAGADGCEIEWFSTICKRWSSYNEVAPDMLSFCINEKYRIKPRTIKVNGFDVPAPMSEAPSVGDTYFIASLSAQDMQGSATWQDDEYDIRYLSRGICHTTKESAIAHAKAMIGIDPNGGDE